MYLQAPTIILDNRTRVLQKQLLSVSFLNLLLVALSGVWLRTFPFYEFPVNFKNLLHGHSHFAFGGWVMPVLVALMMRYIPFLSQKITFTQWRNVSLLLLVSAYGMLASFPFGGYYLVSIIFSTLSVIAGFYLAYLVFKACRGIAITPVVLFLQWGMFYGILSSIGPFLTGPLIAMGYQGTPVYYNAIYFYLHFQYNGLFTFLLLAIFYSAFFPAGKPTRGIKVFFLLNSAILPTFALSLLWNKPGIWLNIIGGWGALLQMASLVFLVKDVLKIKPHFRNRNFIFLIIMLLGIKFSIQLASALPTVVDAATMQKNFIIAYLHFVLIGCISLFAFAVLWPAWRRSYEKRYGVYFFIAGFILTETLLVTQSVLGLLSIPIPLFNELIFVFSLFLPLGVICILFKRRGWSEATQVDKSGMEKYLQSAAK